MRLTPHGVSELKHFMSWCRRGRTSSHSAWGELIGMFVSYLVSYGKCYVNIIYVLY